MDRILPAAKGLRCITSSECSVIEEDFQIGTAKRNNHSKHNESSEVEHALHRR